MIKTADKKRRAFDEIAERYDDEIPKHIREHLCAKKVGFMVEELERRSGPWHGRMPKGLDCGCGTGWHVKRFRENGFDVIGLDISQGMVRNAKKNNEKACFVTASSCHIPFREQTFDFAYLINILHHLKAPDQQRSALEELRRVIKIGGGLFIHEVDETFWLFRIYMRYIFPLTNRIHSGERKESYIDVKSILAVTGDDWSLVDVKYCSILPNITPRFIFPAMKRLEAFFEAKTGNRFGAHSIISLRRIR